MYFVVVQLIFNVRIRGARGALADKMKRVIRSEVVSSTVVALQTITEELWLSLSSVAMAGATAAAAEAATLRLNSGSPAGVSGNREAR